MKIYSEEKLTRNGFRKEFVLKFNFEITDTEVKFDTEIGWNWVVIGILILLLIIK